MSIHLVSWSCYVLNTSASLEEEKEKDFNLQLEDELRELFESGIFKVEEREQGRKWNLLEATFSSWLGKYSLQPCLRTVYITETIQE